MIKSTKVNLKKKIIVTGANGFTGRFVCQELIERNIPFSVILRPGTDYQWFKEQNILIFYADINSRSQLSEALIGSYTLINIASIGFGAAKTILAACKLSSVKRVIFISSTSLFTKLNAKSKKLRIEAENLIKKSDLNWTIFRPTMIYGSPDDRNMIKLIRWIDKRPLIPIFGKGNCLQQPIFVKDLAWAIVEVIDNKKTLKNIYNLSGKEPISFNQIINIISKNLKKKPIKIFLPYHFAARILSFVEFLGINFFIKSEQIMRLNEDKNFSHSKAEKTFGFRPKKFSDVISIEIRMYKKLCENNKKFKI